MNVSCRVEEILLQGDRTMVDSTRVTCSRCGRQTEAFGISQASKLRCFAKLREECLMEENFYEDEAEQKKRQKQAAKGPRLPTISLKRTG